MFAGVGDLFDAAAMYDEDYLYFFAAPGDISEFAVHGPVVPGAGLAGEAVAELARRLLDLRPGMSVLDLACGHGELANRLAARGCAVTSLDIAWLPGVPVSVGTFASVPARGARR